MTRAVFEDCGGFDEGLPRWGCEDDELSLRLWMLGYECHVVPDVVRRRDLARERVGSRRERADPLERRATGAAIREMDRSPALGERIVGKLGDFFECQMGHRSNASISSLRARCNCARQVPSAVPVIFAISPC